MTNDEAIRARAIELALQAHDDEALTDVSRIVATAARFEQFIRARKKPLEAKLAPKPGATEVDLIAAIDVLPAPRGAPMNDRVVTVTPTTHGGDA